VTDTIRYRQK